MFHHVQKYNYTTLQLVQTPTKVDGEKYNFYILPTTTSIIKICEWLSLEKFFCF